MGTEKARRLILEKLRRTFIHAAKAHQGIDKSKMISSLCMEYGVTRRKAQEYIDVLKSADFIEEDEYGLWVKNPESYKIDENKELDEVFNAKPTL